MPLSHKQFLDRVSNLADPFYLCEVLDITSEDILERFDDLIEEKIDVLREVFDIDLDIEGGELDE